MSFASRANEINKKKAENGGELPPTKTNNKNSATKKATQPDNLTPNGNATEGRVMSQKEVPNADGHTVVYENIDGVNIKAGGETPTSSNTRSQAVLKQMEQDSNDEAKQKEATMSSSDNDPFNYIFDNVEQFQPDTQEEERKQDNGVPLGRYNWNLQHGWTIPSMSQDWLKNAEEENKARVGLYQNQQQSNARANAMRERVKEQARNRDLRAWLDWKKDVQAGKFHNLPGRQFNREDAFSAGRNIITDYVANGGTVVGGKVVGLPALGGNFAGFKANTTDARKASGNAVAMNEYIDSLKRDLSDGTYGTGAKKGTYDAVIQRVQKILTDAGATSADAEKVRIQYLYLPEEKQKQYQANLQAYLDALHGIATAAGGDKAWTNVNSKVQRLVAGLKAVMTSENTQGKLQGGMHILNALNNLEGGIVDIGANLQAAKEAWRAFQDNMVLIADIDPSVLYNQLSLARNLAVKQYNNIVDEAGGISRDLGATTSDKGIKYENYKREPLKTPNYTIPVSRDPLPNVGSNYNVNGTGGYWRR